MRATAGAAQTAQDLQRDLATNKSRLSSARAYIERLRTSDSDAGFEMRECWERIDVLLDERIALRARL